MSDNMTATEYAVKASEKMNIAVEALVRIIEDDGPHHNIALAALRKIDPLGLSPWADRIRKWRKQNNDQAGN